MGLLVLVDLQYNPLLVALLYLLQVVLTEAYLILRERMVQVQ